MIRVYLCKYKNKTVEIATENEQGIYWVQKQAQAYFGTKKGYDIIISLYSVNGIVIEHKAVM